MIKNNKKEFRGAPAKIKIGKDGQVFGSPFSCPIEQKHDTDDEDEDPKKAPYVNGWCVLDHEDWNCTLCGVKVADFIPFPDQNFRPSFYPNWDVLHGRSAMFCPNTCIICGKTYRLPKGWDSEDDFLDDKIIWKTSEGRLMTWVYCTQNEECNIIVEKECEIVNMFHRQSEFLLDKEKLLKKYNEEQSEEEDEDEEEEEEEEEEKEKGYLVELCGTCVHKKTNEEKCLTVPFLFKSEEHLEDVSGDSYDALFVPFNNWLQKHGKKGWYLCDVIECYGKLKQADDPIIVIDDEEEEKDSTSLPPPLEPLTNIPEKRKIEYQEQGWIKKKKKKSDI